MNHIIILTHTILKQNEKKLLEQKVAFSLAVLLFTFGNLTLIITVLSIFSYFYLNGFLDPVKLKSRSRFCSVNENFLNCFTTCPAMFFIF